MRTDARNVTFRLAELERRVDNILRLGTVAEADYATARVRVESGDLLTGWIPWLTRRASHDSDWWAPEIGEQVLLLSPGGDPACGVCLPAVYQTAHPPPADACTVRRITYKDGTVVEYDRDASKITVTCVGDIVVEAAGDIDMTAAGNMRLVAARIDLNP